MKKLFTLTVWILLQTLVTIPLYSQIKANPDNFFIRPGLQKSFDVLKNDDPGSCVSTMEDLVVTIVSPTTLPTGVTRIAIQNNKLVFRSAATFQGQVKVEYKIYCPNNGGESSTSYAYVNVGDQPDFIDDVECIIDPVPFVWDIERKAFSTEKVHSYASPIIGDVDGDGIPEIVTMDFWANSWYSDNLVILNNDLTLKSKIKIPRVISYVILPLAIAKITDIADGQEKVAIFVALWDLGYKLRAYTWDGTIIWESSDPCFSFPATTRNYNPSIVVSDINGDGNVEVLAGDRIFAGESGKLLATLPTGGLGRREQASSPTVDGFMPVIADIDGDGKMEIVGGNTTYKVEINSRTNPALNTATILASVPYNDGYTSVADIDGDGILDVIVVADDNNRGASGPTHMYVWQGSTGQLIGTPQKAEPGKQPNTGIVESWGRFGSRAFIGDINNDGKPEICFTSYCALNAFAFDDNTGDFVSLWKNKYTTDTSGATTISMFDFDNDGEVELIYRDETDLRILNKHGDNIVSFPCFSGTHTEYPAVADMDGDGHAEIIVSGSLVTQDNMDVRMMIYGSVTPNAWAPARAVVNQHGYNPLWINEDLSVPAKPLSLPTKVAHKDGTEYRPFNNFLQQAGVLSSEGLSLNKAPDLAFVTTTTQRIYHNTSTDKMEVTVTYMNSGAVDYEGNLKFALYVFDKTTNKYILVGNETVLTNQEVEVAEVRTTTFYIDNYSTIEPTLPALADRQWFITLNKNQTANGAAPETATGTGYMTECSTWNNMTGRISYLNGSIVLCKDESGTLKVNPSGVYDCYWFKVGSTGKVAYPSAASNKGDSQTVTKTNSDYSEFYLIDIYAKGTTSKISTDSVFVYLRPDTLIWTGAKDANWHNKANWKMNGDDARDKEQTYIPRSCTNVVLSKDATRYPNLQAPATDYSVYSAAICNDIILEPGAELLASHLLTYTKAYVQMEIESNRWYCYTPPLQNFYAGDIYQTDKNPYDDGMFAYLRMLQVKQPNFSYSSGGWGRTFTEPDVTFEPGQAVGMWIDDLTPNYKIRQNMAFAFPKTDTEYYKYDEDGNQEIGPFQLNRTKAYRFLYEKSQNNTTKAITLAPEATAANVDIMIGNPLMSHLDFDKFYAENSQYIENYYRIMNADFQYPVYYSSGGVSTGGLTKNIAPMQAIIIRPKKAFAAHTLKVTPDMALSIPGASLKSQKATSSQNPTEYLRINLSDNDIRSTSLLLLNKEENIDLNYKENIDITKMVSELFADVPSVYIQTNDNKYVDIKSVTDLENKTVKVGLYYSGKGTLALGFDRLWDFATDLPVSLHDAVTNKTVNLRESSIYTFSKNENDKFVDNRFSLIFGNRNMTGIQNDAQESNIYWTTTGTELNIYAKGTEQISQVSVYDLQGRIVQEKVNLNTNHVSFSLVSGMYIVRVTTNNKAQTLKVSL